MTDEGAGGVGPYFSFFPVSLLTCAFIIQHNQKLQEMETETALLQQLLSAQSSAAQSSLHASLSATAPFDRVDNSLHSFVTSQENTSKDHFQSSISSIQTALGDLQDRLGGVMDGAAAGRQSWLKNGIDEKRKHGFW